MAVYRSALERGITVGPGTMFPTSDAYRHFIRLNYRYASSPGTESALRLVGQLVASTAR